MGRGRRLRGAAAPAHRRVRVGQRGADDKATAAMLAEKKPLGQIDDGDAPAEPVGRSGRRGAGRRGGPRSVRRRVGLGGIQARRCVGYGGGAVGGPLHVDGLRGGGCAVYGGQGGGGSPRRGGGRRNVGLWVVPWGIRVW